MSPVKKRIAYYFNRRYQRSNMTLVVLGIDALDPDLVDAERHPNLALDHHRRIETIVSSSGEPSTHELWPTIITGLRPDEHGLELGDDGVAWGNPLLDFGSRVADIILPNGLQTQIGAWLLNQTNADAFRTPATYYPENGLTTVFDDRNGKAIGIPNYVVDPDETDREHRIRQSMGELFERDLEAVGGHRSSDPRAFYERCMEMSMVRIARTRRALRSREYELVFGYTSGLDLIGHVAYDSPAIQERAYDELNEFVGEVRSDLGDEHELVLVSDHGLQDGLHTDEAMVAGTTDVVEEIDSVLDVRPAIETELERRHQPEPWRVESGDCGSSGDVKEQLEDLGYM